MSRRNPIRLKEELKALQKLLQVPKSRSESLQRGFRTWFHLSAYKSPAGLFRYINGLKTQGKPCFSRALAYLTSLMVCTGKIFQKTTATGNKCVEMKQGGSFSMCKDCSREGRFTKLCYYLQDCFKCEEVQVVPFLLKQSHKRMPRPQFSIWLARGSKPNQEIIQKWVTDLLKQSFYKTSAKDIMSPKLCGQRPQGTQLKTLCTQISAALSFCKSTTSVDIKVLNSPGLNQRPTSPGWLKQAPKSYSLLLKLLALTFVIHLQLQKALSLQNWHKPSLLQGHHHVLPAAACRVSS